ncbi:hypothetical protein KY347_04600 [Candidatus Woesearchaeota archaeon]|nr:hypothetical protein [Candidatus Woesearchaeota archaeon]
MNRQLIAQRVRKPLESLVSDLEKIYTHAVKEGLYHSLSPHEIYQNIGKGLINYHLSEEYGFFSDLREDFGRLGWSVAYLTERYKDGGLALEELAWLGLKRTEYLWENQKDPNSELPEKDILEISDNLKSKPPIKDCNENELRILLDSYLGGKADYLTYKYPYGTRETLTKALI